MAISSGTGGDRKLLDTIAPHTPHLYLLLLLLRLRLRFWLRVWQGANELSQNVSHSSACTLTKRLYAPVLHIRQLEGYSLLLGCHSYPSSVQSMCNRRVIGVQPMGQT